MQHTRRRLAGTGLALAAVLMSFGAASQEISPGDAERGERAFRQCAACHTFDPEQRRPGPHLRGLFGREAGSVQGFRYSKAMRESTITWNEETLRDYIANPRGAMPGTSMVLRVRRPQTVEDLIEYLRQQSGE